MEDLAEYTASCQKCDRKRYLIDVDRDITRARTCDECFDVCPACNGQEYTYETDDRGYRIARRCPVCGALNQRIKAFNDAAIPRRHSDSTLSPTSFQVRRKGPDGRDGAPIGNLSEVRFKLYNWAKGFEPGDQGFVLHGKVGTGKTHLLVGTVRHLTLDMGIPTKFVEFTHLLSDIRRQFDQGKGETSILAPLVKLPVLAIDELGKGRNTDWQLSIIDEIISKRYNQSLTTLFTTNYPLDDDGLPSGDATSGEFHRKATGSTLRERVGDRVYSRLFDMAEFVELDAPDYRKRKRE